MVSDAARQSSPHFSLQVSSSALTEKFIRLGRVDTSGITDTLKQFRTTVATATDSHPLETTAQRQKLYIHTGARRRTPALESPKSEAASGFGVTVLARSPPIEVTAGRRARPLEMWGEWEGGSGCQQCSHCIETAGRSEYTHHDGLSVHGGLPCHAGWSKAVDERDRTPWINAVK